MLEINQINSNVNSTFCLSELEFSLYTCDVNPLLLLFYRQNFIEFDPNS